MKSWGVSIASEQKQRSLLKDQLSEMKVLGESVPFSFKMKSGGHELRPAPFAFVNDLKSTLFHLLEEKQRLHSITDKYTNLYNDRLGQLTWHDGLIPPTEIWVKVGGDKGGTSFKASLQIVNVERPNSVKNSCVFAVFEAPDTYTNLYIAFKQFKNQITDIQQSKWK